MQLVSIFLDAELLQIVALAQHVSTFLRTTSMLPHSTAPQPHPETEQNGGLHTDEWCPPSSWGLGVCRHASGSIIPLGSEVSD